MAAASPGAILCADSDGTITHWNAAAERLFGWHAGEAIGQPLEIIIPAHMHAAHQARFARRGGSDAVPFPGRVVELPALRRDGSTFAAEVTLSRWREGGQLVFGASIHDISERRAAEDRLRYLAHHDPLTGLANRGRLAELANEAATMGKTVGLVLLDLARFKYASDTLGHGAGDVLLAEIGQRLAAATMPGDTLARLWGNKFALLSSASGSPGEMARRARALQASLDDPFRVGGRSIRVQATVGIAVATPDGARSVMAEADLALAQAKSAGPGQCRTFNPAMRTATIARRALQDEVCAAAEADEFVLHYQPQFRLHDGCLIGAEALLRWQHGQRGLLAPAQFLAALEAGPMAGRTGDWAIGEACRQARMWWDRGLRLRVAVNLFAEQLRGGLLADTVRRALDRYALPAAALELEVTETISLPQNTPLLAALHTLHRHGVQIALDDFGTGFASLSTLQRCPFDRLKIDRSFVSSLGTAGAIGAGPDRSNVAIIDGIVALGRGLGVAVLAEGVETAGQAAFLAARGCDEVQGYHFGRPAEPQSIGCGVEGEG